MPVKNRYNSTPAQQSAPPPQESNWLDKLRTLAGIGIRGGSSILAGPGGIWGAAASGIGEGAAQLVEEGRIDPKRMGVEAGLGAIPGGAIIKQGKILASAARSGAMAGAGDVMRQMAENDSVDPTQVNYLRSAGAGTAGGIIGGALTGFFRPRAAAKPGLEIETTAVPGGTVLGGGKIVTRRDPRTGEVVTELTGAEPTAVMTPRGSYNYGVGREVSPSPHGPYRETSHTPYGHGEPPPTAAATDVAAEEALLDKQFREGMRAREMKLKEGYALESLYDRQFQTAMRGRDTGFEADQALAAQRAAAAEIEASKAGLTPQSSVSETITANIPGGTARKTTQYVDSESAENADDGMLDELSELFGGPARKPRPSLSARQAKEVPPEGTPFRQVYDAWIQRGAPHDNAITNAADLLMPDGSRLARPKPGFAQAEAALESSPTGRIPDQPPVVAPPAAVAASFNEDPPLLKTPDIPDGPPSDDTPLAGLLGVKPKGGPKGPKPTKAQKFQQQINEILAASEPKAAAPALTRIAPEFEDISESVGKGVQIGDAPPPAAPPSTLAKLASERKQFAQENFPPEVNEELDALRAQYDALPKGPEKREIGKQMSQIRQFMEGTGKWAPGAKSAPSPAAVPEPPVVAPAPPEIAAPDAPIDAKLNWVQEQLDLIRKMGGDESGQVALEPLMSLFGGVAGGLTAAAVDPLDNPFLSGLAGAGAGALGGAAIPSLLRSIGAPDDTLRDLDSAISSLDGVKAKAREIAQRLPQFQRFNYLSDAVGLPANMWVGPYGSLLTGALEAGLSGDPRGWQMLKEMNPVRFLQTWRESIPEASELIKRGELGRSENITADLTDPTQMTKMENMMALPGWGMTAGDVAARKIAQSVGFSDVEARNMTLTGEPSGMFRTIADFGKGEKRPFLNVLANMALPFKRTPANIAEQGMQRLPGVGTIIQGIPESPEAMRQQLVQQGMSAGIGAASYGLGAGLDPETGKTARRYVTNLSGRYSLPAGIGFAAGQATQRGRPAGAAAVVAGVDDALPFPTTEAFRDWAKFISQPTGQNLPGGVMPRQLKELLFPQQASGLPPMPGAWRTR